MDTSPLASIRRWIDPRLTALVLALVPASCAGELSEPDAVQATVEITGQGAAALSVGSIQWIDGTYGAGCVGRAGGNWSARVSGNAAMDYAALTVTTNNSACTLTLTKVVADTTYTGSPSIAMTGSYAGSASSFTASATLTPTKDAYVCGGGSTGNNFGANSTVDLKWHTVSFDRNGWFSFDTSGYSSITSAILSLYLAGVGTGEVSPTDQVVKAYYAPSASDSWTEGTGTTNVPTTTGLTWTNAPSPGDNPSGSIASTTVPVSATAGTTFTWDVTSGVKADNDGTATIVLSSWEGGDTNHALQFGSRESANPPTLALTYGLFYGNAYLSSTSFSSDFVVNLLVSDVPSASTASVTGFGAHCTASTPLWVTGFESGVVSTAGGSITPSASLFNAVGAATPTADQTMTRSGNVALEVTKANGTTQYVQKTNLGSTPTTIVGRLGIRLSSLPAADVTELAKFNLTAGANAVLGFKQSTSQFTMGFSGGTLRAGPASTASWGANSFNTSDVYHIVNKATGLCLDDPNGVATNNNPIDLATCSSNSKMSWKFVTAGTGYQLVNQSESSALNQGGSTTTGGVLSIWTNTASSSTNLRWNVVGDNNGYAHIVSQTATNMCAADPSSGGAGTQQDQETCAPTSANEQWSIVDQTNATGAVVAGQWYRIDYRIKVGANPNTIDWEVDGVSQTQATAAQAATTLTGTISLGSTVSADTYTAWYDDVIVTASSGDYPILNGQALFLQPSSYQGKSDPNTYMKYYNGSTTQTVGSTTWQYLDKFPMTSTSTYVEQLTSSGTNYYAEFGFPTVTNTSCINGVSAVVAANASATSANTSRHGHLLHERVHELHRHPQRLDRDHRGSISLALDRRPRRRHLELDQPVRPAGLDGLLQLRQQRAAVGFVAPRVRPGAALQHLVHERDHRGQPGRLLAVGRALGHHGHPDVRVRGRCVQHQHEPDARSGRHGGRRRHQRVLPERQ